jgi:hypothetical protein
MLLISWRRVDPVTESFDLTDTPGITRLARLLSYRRSLELLPGRWRGHNQIQPGRDFHQPSPELFVLDFADFHDDLTLVIFQNEARLPQSYSSTSSAALFENVLASCGIVARVCYSVTDPVKIRTLGNHADFSFRN